MPEEVLKFTKLVFLVHVIVAAVFVILYLMPAVTLPALGMTYSVDAGSLARIIASIFAGLLVGSLLGYLAKEFKEIKILLLTEIVWLGTGIIVVTLSPLPSITPAIVFYVVAGPLLVLFLLSYLKQIGKLK